MSPPVVVRRGAGRWSYRSGGWNVAADTENPPLIFRPETVTDYEVGLKSEFLDRRVRLNLAAYRSNYKDIQKATLIFTPAGAALRRTDNAATAVIQGVEAELLASVSANFKLDSTLAYTDAHYTDFIVRNQAGVIVDDRTNEPFEVPKWVFTVGAKYMWDLPVGRASARLDWYWQDSVIFNGVAALKPTEQILRQGSYGLWGARVEWNVPERGLSVAVIGKNLADKKYNIAGTDVRSVGVASSSTGIRAGSASRCASRSGPNKASCLRSHGRSDFRSPVMAGLPRGSAPFRHRTE